MTKDAMYHEGSRHLQDRFDSRRIADRLEQVTVHDFFTDDDRDFVENSPMFFLATADEHGQPDCSYKGGLPGFVRVVDEHTLAFPNYDGNGMYRSMGNIVKNPQVGMLFIDFEYGDRMRVNGEATFHYDDPLLKEFEGAQFIVRIRAKHVFLNCPRYIHHMEMKSYSVYAPKKEHTPPVPDWKRAEVFCDYLPERDRATIRKKK
jgi:predicted pyridoxine 5'-phosphate oxidase superfamily flavin-nucleotide-binding protein